MLLALGFGGFDVTVVYRGVVVDGVVIGGTTGGVVTGMDVAGAGFCAWEAAMESRRAWNGFVASESAGAAHAHVAANRPPAIEITNASNSRKRTPRTRWSMNPPRETRCGARR